MPTTIELPDDVIMIADSSLLYPPWERRLRQELFNLSCEIGCYRSKYWTWPKKSREIDQRANRSFRYFLETIRKIGALLREAETAAAELVKNPDS